MDRFWFGEGQKDEGQKDVRLNGDGYFYAPHFYALVSHSLIHRAFLMDRYFPVKRYPDRARRFAWDNAPPS